MRITPKLALTTAAILMAIGLLWLGFVEGGRTPATISHGAGVAGQNPGQLIVVTKMTASAIPGFAQTEASPAAAQPQDNVPALALSVAVIAFLVMLALAYARFQAVPPAVHAERATSRRTRLVASGPPQL